VVRDEDIEMVKDAGLERELSRYISDLSSNQDVLGLVRSMQPLDIATCIQTTFDIVPKQALILTLNLLKTAKLKELTVQGTVTNQYPLPIGRKKEDNENEVPNSVKEYIVGPEPFRDSEFPPAPRSNAQKWPYDPNTLFITDPKIKGKKKPLMQSYEPVLKSKKNQGGSPGLGTFQQAVKIRKQRK